LLQEDLEKAVRHELGHSRSARIELLATRSQAREAEAALAELDEALVEARIALLDAMGQRFPFVTLTWRRKLPRGSWMFSEDECLRLARAHRPEIRVAENLMESARLARTMAISPFYPKVDLSGFYGRSGSAFTETDQLQMKKDWNAG
jgi:outer membrane protein TolC